MLISLKKSKSMHFQRFMLIAITSAFSLCSTLSFAQYVWIDEKGSKQFSDQPPPANVPAQRILKSPVNKANSNPVLKPATDLSTPSKAETPVTAVTPLAGNEKLQKPATTANKNEEFLKRKKEQEEKDKKAAAEQQAQAEKQKDCQRVMAYKKSIESGKKITSIDKNGETVVLSEKEISQELNDIQRSLSNCK